MPVIQVLAGFILGLQMSVHAEGQSVEESVVVKLKQLSQMREALSATLDGKNETITEETFRKVCAPVGKELKAWSEKHGYLSRQVSEKYRNPNHAPTPRESAVLKRFANSSKLEELVEQGEMENLKGKFVYVPIRVAMSCLHCHGEKGERPGFIQSKYREDRAFGFRAGDLRGMYSVFVATKNSQNQE